MQHATSSEHSLSDIISKRKKDWRVGPIVYQVLVDRFAPSQELEKKRHLYPAPKQLKAWNEVPKHGEYLEQERLWSHEIEFWGGDLKSLAGKLDYVKALGADVLYLNPIHEAYTNHKYDSLDFEKVSPEFGCRKDVSDLASILHQMEMKLVLDGVFNHMGQNAERFVEASASPESEYRDWFFFGEGFPGGHRCWNNAINLPELNMEHPQVKSHLYLADDSVVKGYLNEGVDGWRLDVAHDIGFNILSELTEEAHECKPDSLVIGEVWSYPQQWLGSLDGVMNLTFRTLIIQTCAGEINPQLASKQLQQLVELCDYEGLLKSWLLLDNHDTVRLVELLPESNARMLAQVLQFCLPGAPNLYYGSELGMEGGDDPEMRAPMRWDLVDETNPHLKWIKTLVTLRQENPALRFGEFEIIHTHNLLAFVRFTEKVSETLIVVVNPNDKATKEHLLIPQSKLMNMGEFTELLGQYPEPVRINSAFMVLDMPPKSAAIFKPNTAPVEGYTSYKRVL